MKRELLIVQTGRVTGSVVIDGDRVEFNEYAGETLAGLRRKLGDVEAAREVMAGGWSNGYVYFGPASTVES